jgi:hypothetical protein
MMVVPVQQLEGEPPGEQHKATASPVYGSAGALPAS